MLADTELSDRLGNASHNAKRNVSACSRRRVVLRSGQNESNQIEDLIEAVVQNIKQLLKVR
jgi:hypothetical protein